MGDIVDHVFRVRYAETDQMGWVYHSHYLTWFEMGRTEFIRDRGVPYREIEKRGYFLPLVKATLELRQPARYDDLLTVRTGIASLASRQIVFGYEILREGETISVGTSTHLCTDASTGRAVIIPDWIRELLGVQS
jgi:acyl-CoA thioester hydrolase